MLTAGTCVISPRPVLTIQDLCYLSKTYVTYPLSQVRRPPSTSRGTVELVDPTGRGKKEGGGGSSLRPGDVSSVLLPWPIILKTDRVTWLFPKFNRVTWQILTATLAQKVW